MKPNDSPPPLVRAVVACVVLGVLLVSCGDDDDSAATAQRRGHPVRDGWVAHDRRTAELGGESGDVCADREHCAVDALTSIAEGTNGVTGGSQRREGRSRRAAQLGR